MPYEGKISGRYFHINRIIRHRNSFLPRISGTIQPEIDGTIIEVKMQLHVAVIVFILIWCSACVFTILALLISMIGNKEFHLVACLPLGMLLFMYALTMGGFKSESSKSKKYLLELLEAEII